MNGRTSASPLRSPVERARPAGGATNTVGGSAFSLLSRCIERRDAPVPVPPSHCQGTYMADHWPLQTFLELGALPGAVPCARLHARQLLWEWGKQRVLHGVGIRVRLRGGGSRVLAWVV